MNIIIVLIVLFLTNYFIYLKIPFALNWKKQSFFLIGILLYHTMIGSIYGVICEIVFDNSLFIKSYVFFVLHLLSIVQIYLIYLFSALTKLVAQLFFLSNVKYFKLILILSVSLLQLLISLGLIEFR